MDKTFPSREKFAALTPSMLLSALLDLSHFIEKYWDQTSVRIQHLSLLKQYLFELNQHKDADIQNLYQLNLKITETIDYKTFLAIITPIERHWHRTCFDHDILVSSQDKQEKTTPYLPVYFILDDIRSSFNVGSIFRVAECFAIKEIYLCGYTSSPLDTKTLKTTMGTHQFVAWQQVQHIESLIEDLKQKNITIYAIETVSSAAQIDQSVLQFPAAFIFGNERFGISPHILKCCHAILKVDLKGQKNSLNVGVCAGIVGYEISKQLKV